METQLGPDAVDMEPGTYTLTATQDGKTLEGAEVEIEAGKAYTAKVAGGLLGNHAVLSDDGYVMPAIKLAWSEANSAYVALDLGLGTYDLTVAGKAAGQIEIDGDGPTYILVSGGRARRVPVLLKEGKSATEGMTGADGSTDFLHLAPGTYRVAEVEAPAGYVEAPGIKTFTVGADGRIDGRDSGQAAFEDDYTKVRISKRDITDESEIEGAKLTVTDSEGKTVDSWTSTAEDHEIDALAPGKYTLTEQRTPTAYDQAESIEFEVRKTGEVQTVTMYDSPISISGEIDKRQEIADPTAKDTDANGDGLNTAETKASDDGSYAYTIDFRSTSNTWTDEFTVEDDLTAAADGRAQLTSITTPQALDDYDGKMNVWYRTDKTPDDYIDESGANATLSDGPGCPTRPPPPPLARTAEPSTSPDGSSGAPTCPRPRPPSSPWQTSASRRASTSPRSASSTAAWSRASPPATAAGTARASRTSMTTSPAPRTPPPKTAPIPTIPARGPGRPMRPPSFA